MDPYKVLGVSPDADEETIKKAYKELVKKYHPDKYVNNPLADLAAEKMKEINQAYDMIMKKQTSGGAQQQRGGGYGGAGGFGGAFPPPFPPPFPSDRGAAVPPEGERPRGPLGGGRGRRLPLIGGGRGSASGPSPSPGRGPSPSPPPSPESLPPPSPRVSGPG